MAAKVPTTESGRARLGMIVADTLRRKAKITSTTSTSAAAMVSLTSRTESRIERERSNRISTCTEGGSHALKVGRSAVTASATSTVLVPGWRWTARTIERWRRSAVPYHEAVLSSSTLSITCPSSSRRSEEHTSELQSQSNLVCRLLLEKKKKKYTHDRSLC